MNDQLAQSAVEGTTPLRCSNPVCDTTEGVQMESARTAYHWDGKGDNPNAPIPYCRPCADDHHAYWDDQWANVSSY